MTSSSDLAFSASDGPPSLAWWAIVLGLLAVYLLFLFKRRWQGSGRASITSGQRPTIVHMARARDVHLLKVEIDGKAFWFLQAPGSLQQIRVEMEKAGIDRAGSEVSD